MAELVLSSSAYWWIFTLTVVGLYGMLMKKNLVKKLIGLTIFQTSIIIFFVASASKVQATIPVVDPRFGTDDPTRYINPLPHTLMLTAIVVGVATVGLAFALLVSIYRRYRTLNEPHLLERMQ